MRIKQGIALCVVIVLLVTVCLAENNGTSFRGINDPELLPYLENALYDELSISLEGKDYFIDDITAVYISKESLVEEEFNSRKNVYFGYTLEELEERFEGKRFVFTLGTNNETIVEEWESYDDTCDRIIHNVAIGTGVILICVTVSIVTAGIGLTTTSMVFAASAKTGATMALSSGLFGGITTGIIEGYNAENINKVIRKAALDGSEEFKWGAITGAATGALSKLKDICYAAKAVEDGILYERGMVEIPTDISRWEQAEKRALNQYGGYEQLTYLNGKLVDFRTPGGTRPDVVRLLGDHIEAIEVKYYNLENPACVNTLYKELKREVSSRIINLPKGATQRIILDVTDRGFSLNTIETVIKGIQEQMIDIYPDIPIEIVGA